MKKIKWSFILGLVFILMSISPVYADLGDFGFFGGISEGRKLPKTTELLLEKNNNSKDELEAFYKEVIFLDGNPVTFEGMLTTTRSGDVKDDVNADKYSVTYKVENGNSTAEDVQIKREIKYDVNYRKEKNQIVKDYELDSWDETITIPSGEYALDEERSYSTISVLEDHTPGVTYYSGDISQKAVYLMEEGSVTCEISGKFYGYDCAWSSTETLRLDCTVTGNDWQMQYQLRPSVSIGKKLQYSQNEPTAISFVGNYKEIMQNQSGLSYDIFVLPSEHRYNIPTSGNVSIDSFNSFEQLIAPDVSYVKGHFAEDDIRKLFSMQILEGEPKYYQPSQAITRGQFVKALVRAIKLPVEDTTSSKRSRKQVVNVVFPDVMPERDEYKYIMAAYKAELAVGRDNGHFYLDAPIERQEAIVILLRTLGLETLGLDPTPITTFTDNSEIAEWAKKEVYAANRIGIIAGDDDGKFRPESYVSKAEAAALINRLNSYMRYDLQTDYTEHIVNYVN